ncbi:BnaA01g17160D [Brassica napus]|uniref:BnaA01g17160D protein n=1 Tax=Brassica napus TaxID=3708 RepID=A0A078H635_BRANA|nr:BnaA01g17160D [Brassica napus]
MARLMDGEPDYENEEGDEGNGEEA